MSYSKLRFDPPSARRARLDEDADRDRHVLLGDQIVEHRRHVVLGSGAVLEHHDGGGRLRPVLRRARRPTSRASCPRRSCSPTAASASPCLSARPDARGCQDASRTLRAARRRGADRADFVVPGQRGAVRQLGDTGIDVRSSPTRVSGRMKRTASATTRGRRASGAAGAGASMRTRPEGRRSSARCPVASASGAAEVSPNLLGQPIGLGTAGFASSAA